MAGHGDEGSNTFPDGNDFFCQPELLYPSYNFHHTSHQGIQGLDLNSQVDELPNLVEFANLAEYSAYISGQSTRRNMGF
ncbi:unnamed protein product [Urochloa humidicola]